MLLPVDVHSETITHNLPGESKSNPLRLLHIFQLVVILRIVIVAFLLGGLLFFSPCISETIQRLTVRIMMFTCAVMIKRACTTNCSTY